MSLFWAVVIPAFFVVAAAVAFWATDLQFFSRKTRDLEDVRFDLKQLRIEEFENLVSAEADEFVNHKWQLSPRQRREACANRLRVTREWLRCIVCNGELFQQVARFQIAQIVATGGETALDKDHLACKVFDRATMCHLMAAVCLAKLQLIEFCRIAWPFYLPTLAGRFEVRSHSLVAWYQQLVEAALELAREDKRGWMYGHIQLLLTGSGAAPESAVLRSH